MSTKPANDVQFKVKGDDVNADDFNAVLRVAMYHPDCEPTEEVKPWYNAAATACPAYGVAAVTGTNGTEPDKILQGDQPSSTVRKEYIVNTEEECDATSEGTYQNGEWVLALYETGTPALDEVWVPKAAQWSLVKGAAGAPWGIVVAGIVDADEKILLGKIVETPPDELIRATLTEPLYSCDSAQAELLLPCSSDSGSGSGSGSSSGSSETITVYDAIGIVDASLLAVDDAGSLYLPEGTQLYIRWFADCSRYEIVKEGHGCEEGSDSGSGSGSGCLITSDECWIGATNCGTTIHLQPRSKTVPADCCKIHLLYPKIKTNSCGPYVNGLGLYVDDAGHVVGCDSDSSSWANSYSIGTITISETVPGNRVWKKVTLSGGTFPASETTAVYIQVGTQLIYRDAQTVTDTWVSLDQSYDGAYTGAYTYYYAGKNSPWDIDLTNLNPC